VCDLQPGTELSATMLATCGRDALTGNATRLFNAGTMPLVHFHPYLKCQFCNKKFLAFSKNDKFNYSFANMQSLPQRTQKTAM
jgi:hypothetical protein